MRTSVVELDERRLTEVIDSHLYSAFGSREEMTEQGVVVSIESLVVDYANQPRLYDAPPPEQLAWFVYLLATSGAMRMPRGYTPHSVLGTVARGPEHPDALVVQVQRPQGLRVASPPAVSHASRPCISRDGGDA